MAEDLDTEVNKEDFTNYHARLLGQGGMGTVLQVIGPEIDVAVKLIKAHSEQDYVRAMYEVGIQKQINGICGVPDYIGNSEQDVDGVRHIALVMNRGTGIPLSKARITNQPIENRLEGIVGAFETLDQIWNRDIVHGDVKPDNILVPVLETIAEQQSNPQEDSSQIGYENTLTAGEHQILFPGQLPTIPTINPELYESMKTAAIKATITACKDQHLPCSKVKLIDFGLSRGSDYKHDNPKFMKGTPGYMAPEQVRGQPIDSSADVFALSIVTWEELAQRSLFYSPNEQEAITLASQRIAKYNNNLRTRLAGYLINAVGINPKIAIPWGTTADKDIDKRDYKELVDSLKGVIQGDIPLYRT